MQATAACNRCGSRAFDSVEITDQGIKHVICKDCDWEWIE